MWKGMNDGSVSENFCRMEVICVRKLINIDEINAYIAAFA